MIEPDAPLPILLPESSSSDAAAPMLPIEGPIVAAALGAQEVKAKAEWLLFAIQHQARDRARVEQAFSEVHTALNASWDAYFNYSEIRDCRGQG